MLGTSLPEYLMIRTTILLLQYTTPLCLLAVTVLFVASGRPALSWPVSQLLLAYSFLDCAYALFIWRPYNRRLHAEARHPPPLTAQARRALFIKTIDNISDFERYLRLWFLGADPTEIRRENVVDFMLWAFFDTALENASQQDIIEAEEFVNVFEKRLGRQVEEGRGNTRGLRLTLDAVETRFRSLIWFVIVGGVDLVAHCQFAWHGFQYFAQPRSEVLSVIPPRLQSVFASKRSPSRQLAYWHRPHTAPNKVPVVFLHGIGIGLWTYVSFLSRLNHACDRNGDIGIIAVEILPVSFRLTSDPLGKLEFLSHLDTILDNHGWKRFVLAAHSYGTIIASHLIHSTTFNSRMHGIVLLDPVSIMLHLPDVAYNFTRRKPRQANEWQLWYFASMDPGVAHTLGRCFFWRENIIWKEELLALPASEEPISRSSVMTRNVAVCLSERDLIVDTASVVEYLSDGWSPAKGSKRSGDDLAGERGIHHMTRDGLEILWFPGLDHSQMFDKRQDLDRVCSVLGKYCTN